MVTEIPRIGPIAIARRQTKAPLLVTLERAPSFAERIDRRGFNPVADSNCRAEIYKVGVEAALDSRTFNPCWLKTKSSTTRQHQRDDERLLNLRDFHLVERAVL